MIIKQILFITNSKKAQELQKQLYLFSQNAALNNACKACEVYQCDEDSSEYLLFMQWSNQSSYNEFESNELKVFEEKNKSLIIKKEILRLD